MQEKVAIQEEVDRVNRLNPGALTRIAEKSGEGNIRRWPGTDRQVTIESTEIAEKRAEVEHIVYKRQKELADRALKMAEVGNPKSNWQMQGLLGIAAFVIGLLMGR